MKTLLRKIQSLVVLIVLMALSHVGYAQLVVNDGNTSFTNYYEKFEISGTASTGFDIGIEAWEIQFDADIVVPTSIASSSVTVRASGPGGDNTQNASVRVVGNTVFVTSPHTFVSTGPPGGRILDYTITFLRSANIRNPINAGTGYTVNVVATAEIPAQALAYNVSASTSTISQPSVSPNPSVEFRTASYTISFTTGNGGYLTGGVSTITITLPAGTTVPDGSISGITLNSTTATVVGNSATRTMTITAPINIDNGGSVTIVSQKSSGLQNPGEGSGFTASVYTSSETSPQTSVGYSIASAANLSFADISLSDNTVNSTASYTVSLSLSNTGALSSSLGDRVVIKFPPSITLPATIATSNVSFYNVTSGFGGTPSSVTVDADSIYFPVPVPVAASAEIEITFAAAAGIVNSGIPSTETLFAATYESGPVVIDAQAVSNSFTFFASSESISAISVSPNPATASTAATYTITGSTGANGRLVEGAEVNVVFPSGTSFGDLSASTFEGQTIITYSTSSTTFTFDIPVGGSVANSTGFTLIIPNVTNPAANSYTLDISSEPEPNAGTSESYVIGGASFTTVTATMNTTTANSDYSNTAGNYRFAFTGGTALNGPGKSNQSITVKFPANTTIPATIANASVRVNGAAAGTSIGSVVTDQDLRKVDIVVTPNNFTPTSVEFLVGANILNPPVPNASFYTVSVSTSQQTSPRTSSTYAIVSSPNSPTVNSASASPNTYGSTAEIAINFTTSAIGRTKGGTVAGSDKISVDFGALVTVPASVSNTNVKINNTTVTSVTVLSSGAGGEIEIVVPSGVDISNSTAADITILKEAGFTLGDASPAPTATTTVAVKTTSDATYSTATNNLSLQETLDISVESVALSDARKNASSSYTVSLTNGTSGAITTGNNIIVTFPSATYVPPTLDKTNVLVNGVNPTSNPTISGNEITIVAPADIAAETSFTIQFSSLAGILNPSTTGSYTLDVATTTEPAGDASNSYTITSATSTVSQANVTLSNYNATPSPIVANYTIDFSTGNFGRLLSGTSTIVVTFPAATAYGSFNATGDVTVNGTAATYSLDAGNDELTITVPGAEEILNNESVQLVINNISNPGTAAFYTLDVRTSIETTDIASTAYEISDAPPITFFAPEVAVTDDTVNGTPQYTFNFDVTSALGGGETITLLFPSGSVLPASIATTNITINGGNPSGITTNIPNRTVTMTLAGGHADNGTSPNITVVVAPEALVYNPKEPGTYTYQARTSLQSIYATTTTSITILASTNSRIQNMDVVGSPQSVSEAINWTWTFTTGRRGALQSGVGTVVLDFGGSIFNSANVPASTVTVQGVTASTVVTDAVGKLLTVTVPNSATIGNSAAVTIVVSTGANIWPNPNLLKTPSKVANPSNPTTQALDDYSVSSSSEASASQFQANPLPIELTSFKVLSTTEKGFPNIIWTTATEVNNYGFQLQRKHTGADETFVNIAFIEGAGTTYSPSAYSFIDEEMSLAGEYLYQLVQYDYNGDSKVYGPIFHIFQAPDKFELSDAFPNPFNPTTNIRYSIAAPEKIQLYVYDTLGRKVATLVNEQMAPGTYTVTFDAAQLASGMYFIRMIAQNQSHVKKILLVK